jgi:hypothetical protein
MPKPSNIAQDDASAALKEAGRRGTQTSGTTLTVNSMAIAENG